MSAPCAIVYLSKFLMLLISQLTVDAEMDSLTVSGLNCRLRGDKSSYKK